METKELVTVQLDATQFGLEKSDAKQIESAFVPMAKTMREMEDDYNVIVTAKEITPELSNKARNLRLNYVTIRTSADTAHKEGKAKLLLATRAWDGLRNVLKYAAQDKEENLSKIEKHIELQEIERKKKLREDRIKMLEPFEIDTTVLVLGEMTDEVWENYYNGVKLAHEHKIEAERKAEEERISREKAEREEQERIRKENEQLKKEAEEKEKALTKERAEAEAKRKEIEESARKEREERERIEDELKAKQQAEEKAKADEAARIEAEKKEKAEADKKARLAPDKNKIESFSKTLETIEFPEVKSDEAKKIISDTKELIRKTVVYLKENVNRL